MEWDERLKVQWVSASVRDQIVDFNSHWKQRSGLRDNWFCRVFGLSQEKLIAWRKRYGLPNQHNGAMPKDSWLCAKEKQAHLFLLFEPWRWLSALCLCDD